jgi:AhpC/TSA family
MKAPLSTFLVLATAMACPAKDTVIPTIERNGQPYVSIAALGKDIAIKQLPGSGQWVACAGERCALLKNVARDGDQTLVSVTALADALGSSVRLDGKKHCVTFHFEARNRPADDPIARVGQLAPNFKVVRLDGTAVSLTDFSGKRVLINSWASW